jgi:phage FluMu protein Com
MFINFKCPHCGAALQDTIEFAGKKKRCPRCKENVVVPATDAVGQGEAKEQAGKE